MFLLVCAVAILRACARAAMATSGAAEHDAARSATEHPVNWTSGAELYYLRHLRSQAVSVAGNHTTCTGASPTLCMSGLPFLLVCILKGLDHMQNSFIVAMTYVIQSVLQSTVSALEVVACIVLVEGSLEDQCIRKVLTVSLLLLALSDWHVPQAVPHHHAGCRLLSAMCMQALCPHSLVMLLIAFVCPTFGKRSPSIPPASSRERMPTRGASEHAASPAQGVPSLEQAIARVTRLAEENERAKEILAAAVTLRDSIGRDRQ